MLSYFKRVEEGVEVSELVSADCFGTRREREGKNAKPKKVSEGKKKKEKISTKKGTKNFPPKPFPRFARTMNLGSTGPDFLKPTR